MSKVCFKETQHYQNKLIPLALGLLGALAVVRGVDFLLASEPLIGRAAFLFVVGASLGVLVWWLTQLKLKVAITEKSVKFKLSPIHLKKQSIPWAEIEECEIVRTSEAGQWSGGNLTLNHEKRYSVTGRNGLALKTKDGEYFFIGCRDTVSLQQALRKIKWNKEENEWQHSNG